MKPLISIIIPQYKTLEISRLCLRALKKFSTQNIEVIVVDNNSNDQSLEYLKQNAWIKLIENPKAKIGGDGHKQALDIGVEAAKGDWIVLFHSDTIVLKDAWDKDLINLIKEHPNAVGASSTIREINPFASWQTKVLRFFKDKKFAYHHTTETTNSKIMSYCFLLNKKFLLGTHFKFEKAEGDVADALYKQHIKNQHEFILMGRGFLNNILWHTSNVSSILTGQITDNNLVSKYKTKINRLYSNKIIHDLLTNTDLDNVKK
ncbi:MAG: glycosyltransferase [Methylophilaceae bacterium]|nr:glycosyltransferase [Methylophilaceae bacterium]